MNHRPYHALRFPDFRRLWGAQLVSQTGSQMQVVAINWHVYLLTGSPLALGLLGLVRVVPVIVFSLWGGVVADRRDRRGVLLVSQSVMTLAAIVLSGLTFFHAETTHWLYLLTAVSAAATAFDNPARNALVPRLVPREILPGAIALNLTMFHASMIAGPGLAGLLIAAFGTAGQRGGVAPRRDPVRLPDPGHGLDDDARLLRHLFLGRALAPPDLRGPGPEGRTGRLRHAGRGPGRRRARGV